MNETLSRPELYTTILRVRNLEKSMKWYQNVFGLEPVQFDARYRLVHMVGAKGQKITLRELGGGKEIMPTGLYSAYVVFLTPSATESQAQLKSLGADTGPLENHPGVQLFWVRDPDQHAICVLQFVIDWV